MAAAARFTRSKVAVFTFSDLGTDVFSQLAHLRNVKVQAEGPYRLEKHTRHANIDLVVLWDTITTSLPELQKQIEEILIRQSQETDILSPFEDEEEYKR
ncbi:hypothetical protein ACM1RC_10080 [Paenibacillus azoreducens]|uniref:hypothetical protein n=1 Tax=Paenibacillus azoreducens TaxID=116718 RepID=UPI0039F607AE